MSDHEKLELEVLSGPLDGQRISLFEDAEWTCQGTGLLSFPWDTQLGQPQARFMHTPQGWVMEVMPSSHGIHIRFNQKTSRLNGGRIKLHPGMILKAACSWLLVRLVDGRKLE